MAAAKIRVEKHDLSAFQYLGGATVASVGGGETLWFTVTLTEIQRVAALRLSSVVARSVAMRNSSAAS